MDIQGGQDNPLRLGNHVGELFMEELNVLHARPMGAPTEGTVNPLRGPWLYYKQTGVPPFL